MHELAPLGIGLVFMTITVVIHGRNHSCHNHLPEIGQAYLGPILYY
jgi:hypothetical protein